MQDSVSDDHRPGPVRLVAASVLLLVVFALSATGASSALAAPEFGVCRHVGKKGAYSDAACHTKLLKPKGAYEWEAAPWKECAAMKHGEYTEAACNTKSLKAHKGKYEKLGGNGFSGSAAGATLTLGAVTITCTEAHDTGYMASSTDAFYKFSLDGCTADGMSCQSSGTPPGFIGFWGYVRGSLWPLSSGSPAYSEFATSGFPFSEISCGAYPFAVFRVSQGSGVASAEDTGNVNVPANTGDLIFNAAVTSQG